MKHKRIYYLILALLPSAIWARSVVEFTLDAGYSGTQYTLSEGRLVGGAGYGADLGYAWFFHQNMGLGIGAGFRHYAVLSAYNLNGTSPLGFRNDKAGWQDAHYFMEDYSSLMNTTIVSGKAFPWSVDFEIGIKYAFGRQHASSHRKQYPCRCVID